MRRIGYVVLVIVGAAAMCGVWFLAKNHLLDPSAILRRDVDADLATRWYRYEFIVGDGALEQKWSRTASTTDAQRVRSKCQIRGAPDVDVCEAYVGHVGTVTTRITVSGNQILISRITLP